jgi:hypothetical protein
MKKILNEGKISKLIPDSGFGGLSGEVHLLEHNCEKYVLRKCPNLKTADKYLRIYSSLKKYEFLPKLLWRDRTKIIFEYIGGRDCKKDDALKVAFDIGKMAGIINNLGNPRKINYDIDEKFLSKLYLLEKKEVLLSEVVRKIEDEYQSLKKKAKPKLCIDINDITFSNFRIFNGKTYLVDIEAIKLCPRGVGIAKGFLKWFKTPLQRKRFLEGYNSISDSNFLTKDYKNFIYLYHLVHNIYFGYQRNTIPKNQINKLERLLNDELE